MIAALLLAVLSGPDVPERMTAEEVRPTLERAVRWLVETQHEDGQWGWGVQDTLADGGFSPEAYYDYNYAANALACMALAEVDETPEVRAALERSIEWMCTTREPKRPSDWDADNVWAALYGAVCMTRLADDSRFVEEPWAGKIRERAKVFLDVLERNQVAEGGWAYYDDPPYTRRPKWATSFCTALVLPSLQRAHELGWLEEAAVYERAAKIVARCALPNGAYTYNVSVVPWVGGESINNIRGSLGRTQVCNWARFVAGDERVGIDRVREGIDAFFEHHRFLDVARMRPIPHEAYYANAGYFYLFAHYYAALAIELLPPEEREDYHARLRPHLAKVQNSEGWSTDYLNASYEKTAGTAYTILALVPGLRKRDDS